MWLFNRLVTDPESGLCSHYWGAILRQQLGHVEAWAEKQGLELAGTSRGSPGWLPRDCTS